MNNDDLNNKIDKNHEFHDERITRVDNRSNKFMYYILGLFLAMFISVVTFSVNNAKRETAQDFIIEQQGETNKMALKLIEENTDRINDIEKFNNAINEHAKETHPDVRPPSERNMRY